MARILVVDDDPVDRMILESLLTQEGHDLTFAEDGARALALYRKHSFDLVVTDLVMPTFGGLRLIKEIIALAPDAAIIAISGMSPEQLPLAEDYGARRVLRKPLTQDSLREAVSAVLPRES